MRIRLSVCALVASLGSNFLHAQSQEEKQKSSHADVTLEEVRVTANPLASKEIAPAVDEVSGARLRLRQQSTLGETLNGLPGVSSTYFGPNASRPIIRGLDGDRVKILANSSSQQDVSGLSYDHAVTIDPIAVERIEVLRGPGVLLYGGGAIGGVVNVIDNRIPSEVLFPAKPGAQGKINLGVSSVDRGREAAAAIDTGISRFGLHVDGFKREKADTHAPKELPCTQQGVTTVRHKICNSASYANGVSAGGSLFFERGYIGASITENESHYGTVAEDEVSIRMRSQRGALKAELIEMAGPIKSLNMSVSSTRYRHTEYEAADPKTVFRQNAEDVRVQGRQKEWGGLKGVWGLQWERSQFSADGDEAFVPYTHSSSKAMFVLQELGLDRVSLNVGTRLEYVQIRSDGHPSLARFSLGQRGFQPASVSLSVQFKPNAFWRWSTNLSSNARAPRDYELYAHGPHAATGAYELGASSLGTERSMSLDLGAHWKSGANRFFGNAFTYDFKRFISLEATGASRDSDGNFSTSATALPEYQYRQVRARFNGLETGGTHRWLSGPTIADVELKLDYVRAMDLSSGKALPRIAPLRLGISSALGHGPWGLRVGVDRSQSQNRGVSVAGYTLWHSALTYRQRTAIGELFWTAKLDNATNALAFSSSSILTQSAPGKAPLPGRNFKLGVQMVF